MRRSLHQHPHEQGHHDHDLGPDFERGHRRGPGGHGRGRGDGRGLHGEGGRARRGAVGQSILLLLSEQPMHGYELITALEEKSGGRWRPSPGAMYPSLGRLEDAGLISSTDDDGKRRFELTDKGRERVNEQRDAGVEAPWDEASSGGRGDLRRTMSELLGPVRQIGRFGTPEQGAAAEAVLKEATAKLYHILASPPPAAPTPPSRNAHGARRIRARTAVPESRAVWAGSRS